MACNKIINPFALSASPSVSSAQVPLSHFVSQQLWKWKIHNFLHYLHASEQHSSQVCRRCHPREERRAERTVSIKYFLFALSDNGENAVSPPPHPTMPQSPLAGGAQRKTLFTLLCRRLCTCVENSCIIWEIAILFLFAAEVGRGEVEVGTELRGKIDFPSSLFVVAFKDYLTPNKSCWLITGEIFCERHSKWVRQYAQISIARPQKTITSRSHFPGVKGAMRAESRWKREVTRGSRKN